jgi:hypothetical protein
MDIARRIAAGKGIRSVRSVSWFESTVLLILPFGLCETGAGPVLDKPIYKGARSGPEMKCSPYNQSPALFHSQETRLKTLTAVLWLSRPSNSAFS